MAENTRAGLHPIETASRDEISALQLKRMKWSLSHAYQNVAQYRKKLDAAGVHPEDLKQLSDLPKFPLTDKKDLRDNYPYGMLAVPMQDVIRIHASSGTTGKPTVVGYTKNDIDMWSDLMARSIYAAGGRHDDIAMVSYGYGLFTGGLGAHYGSERLGAAVIPMGGGQTEKQVQLIMDFKPSIIMVTPSYMLVIAEELVRQGVDPRSSSLRLGIHGAEPWSEAMRAEIEAVFDIDAVDIYGLSEVMGPGVACECVETKDGLTLWEDHFYPEIIDPVSGATLPDGELGELVFTSLSKEAMPLIRYRTRDLTRILPGTARTMRRLARITGRSDDMLIIRGVNVFPSQIEEMILKNSELTPVYQLHVDKEGPLDTLAVYAEVRTEFVDKLGQQGMEKLGKELRHHIKSFIGVSCDVHIVEEGKVERTLIGKAKRVVDKRPR